MSPMSNSTARKRDAETRGMTATPTCDHYWAWVSPAGTAGSARLCMTCHQPDPEWLNEIDAALAAHDRALLDAVAWRVLAAEHEGGRVYREGFYAGLDAAASIVRATRGAS